MDFSKYPQTGPFHVTRIRRTDMALMRTALTMAGDNGFTVEAWSRSIPAEIAQELPSGTDRRHGIVRAHYEPGDILRMLEDARSDKAVLEAIDGADKALQQDYRANYSRFAGRVPLSDGAAGE